MTPYYNQDPAEVLSQLKVYESAGLSSEEAKKRHAEYGYNQLESKRRKSFLKMFFAQFKSFMIIILLIAAAISGVVGVMEGE